MIPLEVMGEREEVLGDRDGVLGDMSSHVRVIRLGMVGGDRSPVPSLAESQKELPLESWRVEDWHAGVEEMSLHRAGNMLASC